MSVIAATLKQVFGNAYVIASDGSKRPALEGEHLFNGEQLLTESGASAVLQLANGERLDVASDSLWQAAPATNEAVLASEDDLPSDLEQALAAGFDPTLELEPTAAGPAAGGAGGAGGGHSFILLSETGAQVEATIGFNTSGLDSSAGLLREEQAAQASLSDNASADTTAPTLTVSAPDNSNDSTPTLTGSSDQIGGTVTLTVTDANGA
uniref:retention module-containing protein n=1 Tax=Pseudomonas fluvialis TaxID=1793966 RepID=UPI0035AE8B6F